MDIVKIGLFIKSLRKEAALTQRQVAERLNVSEKTISKWETGRGAPEISLLLPLCKIFGVSMNELLSGERLNGEQYVDRAEQNLASLVNDCISPRKKVVIATLSCIFTIASALALIMLAAYFIAEAWLRVLMIIIAATVIASDIAVILLVAVDTEIYECAGCGEDFVPTLPAYFFAPHTFTRRYLKCPRCGKRCWCRGRIKK